MSDVSPEVWPALQEAGTEIAALLGKEPDNSVLHPPQSEADLEEALTFLLRDANTVVLHPPTQIIATQSRLASKAQEIAHTPGHISPEHASVNGTCFQAELRMARDLGRRSVTSTRTLGRLPSAILFGVDDKPFAFQKADGYPTAYAWRSAWFNTQAGPRFVPEGTIVELPYGEHPVHGVYPEDPRHQLRSLGLVALRSTPPPDDAYLSRISTEFLPSVLRRAAHNLAVQDVPSLGGQLEKAVRLSANQVGDQVTAFLQHHDILTV